MRSIHGVVRAALAGVFCFGAASLGVTGAASAQEELGAVEGTFIVKGEIPKLDPLREKGANIKDAAICSATAVPNQTIVIDPDTKGLANVFVWIDGFDADDIPKSLAEPKQKKVVLDQKSCVFMPHAVVARTGQTLVMLNGDPVAHNVHLNAIRGESFNTLVAANDREGQEKQLTEPDILPVPIKCDIHDWMRANLLVLEHPYGAVSDAKGRFKISGIPPGEYDFKVWQEEAGYLRKVEIEEIEIEAGKTVDLGQLAVDIKDLQ